MIRALAMLAAAIALSGCQSKDGLPPGSYVVVTTDCRVLTVESTGTNIYRVRVTSISAADLSVQCADKEAKAE